jgi:two-component system, NarL family, response regulator NreC
MRPSVLLADDHAMVAEGLSRLIAEVAQLVGIVRDGHQLVEGARRLRPDIVVADVDMPGMSGIEAMRLLKAEGSSAQFIFLTVHGEPRLAAEAMRHGASGYLLKEAAGEELLSAIRAVRAGQSYLTPLITKDVLRALATPSGAPKVELSARQREVLRLIAEGRRMKEIAAALGISVRTVEDHKYQLMRLLDLDSTAALVRFAVKQGLVRE